MPLDFVKIFGVKSLAADLSPLSCLSFSSTISSSALSKSALEKKKD